MTQRIVSSDLQPEESPTEQSLRPHTLSEYIGQERVVENLRISLDAARARGEALDHILFYGPPAWARPPLPTWWPPR